MDMVLHGFICIGCGVTGGEEQSVGHQKVAKKANIELTPNFIIDVDWKVAIDSKVDNLVAGMAKLDSMAVSLVEIKAMLQAR
jgi:hypothetical protein